MLIFVKPSCGQVKPGRADKVVAAVKWVDGTIIDAVRQVVPSLQKLQQFQQHHDQYGYQSLHSPSRGRGFPLILFDAREGLMVYKKIQSPSLIT